MKSDKPKGEKLILQNDGNLVLRANDQTVSWTSGSRKDVQQVTNLRACLLEVFYKKLFRKTLMKVVSIAVVLP